MKENQLETDVMMEVECHRFTPADMAGSLLQSGFTATEIEDRIAAPSGSVQDWLGDGNEISDSASAELLRLKQLYLREQVKSVFRNSPFLAFKKEQIGLGSSARILSSSTEPCSRQVRSPTQWKSQPGLSKTSESHLESTT